MSYWEYAVVVRRQSAGHLGTWELWTAQGKIQENPNFLAVMNWAGAQGFEAYAAGDFDKMGVPEVLLKRPLFEVPQSLVPQPQAEAAQTGQAPPTATSRKQTVRRAKAKETKS